MKTTVGPDLKSLMEWLESLPEKEREEFLNLCKKGKEQKPKAKRVKPGLREPNNQIHPNVQKVLEKMATFQAHHRDIIEEWQKLERELKSERERILAKWKGY